MGCSFLFVMLTQPQPIPDPGHDVATGFGAAGLLGTTLWLAGQLFTYLNTRALKKKDAETGPVNPLPIPQPAPPSVQQPLNPFDRPSSTGVTETIEARVARLERVELDAAFKQLRWEYDDLVRKNGDLLVRLADAYRETDRQRVTVLAERQTSEGLRRENAELRSQVAYYKKLAGEATDDAADTLPPRRKM